MRKNDMKLNKIATVGIATIGEATIGEATIGEATNAAATSLKLDRDGQLIYAPSIEVVKRVENLLKEIQSITDKGFVNKFELNNRLKFPNLSSVLTEIKEKEIKWSALSNDDKIAISKWGHQLLLLRAYTDLIILTEDHFTKDGFSDKKVLEKELYSKLDPSIRVKLQNKGLCLIQNIYSGYDSEYKSVDVKNNKLISVQLAVNTKTLLKLPNNKPYSISKLNPLTDEVYNDSVGVGLNSFKLEEEINKCITKIRIFLNYNIIDDSIERIVKTLIKDGVPYIENEQDFIFSFGRTVINQWFNKVSEKGYSFKDLVKKSNTIAKPYLDSEMDRIYGLLKSIYELNEDITVIDAREGNDKRELSVTDLPIVTIKEGEEEEEDKNIDNKLIGKTAGKYSRTRKQSFTGGMVSVTLLKNNYIIGHLTNADLSILNDFNEIKDNLDIVNNSLVTLKAPMLIDGVNVYVRDSMLLAPGGMKGLDKVGKLYDSRFSKLKLTKDLLNNMDEFLLKDPVFFKEYALRDALIALVHASYMEDFNFTLGKNQMPITLASLSLSYVLNKWGKDGYSGYQISPEYLLSEPDSLQTPKGLFQVGKAGRNISRYIENYKGGRNECFMYGKDVDTVWYDYDLTSAYTSAMSLLGDPDYSKGCLIQKEELLKMTDKEILTSYISIRCSFKFPTTVKYPSIPCFVDKDTTVYPLQGNATILGSEYLLARNQGCELKISEIYLIPYRIDSSSDVNQGNNDNEGNPAKNKWSYQPFKDLIKELQRLRRLHDPGSVNNRILKEIGNSIYGLTTKGISNKMKYDYKTRTSTRMRGNVLSNPLISSWTTAFIRSIIGELLHNISLMDGRVVSVTTDGFITDVEGLEDKILSFKGLNKFLLNEYRCVRKELSGDPRALELKHTDKGILSWTTRGQYSGSGKIVATTGLQRSAYKVEELDIVLNDMLATVDRSKVFIEHSLRSALDICKQGGSVTDAFREKVFRMLFDNRRVIKDSPSNTKDVLIDSNPVSSVSEAALNRFIGNISKTSAYHKNTHTNALKSRYRNRLDTCIRQFIRGLFSKSYNLDIGAFGNYSELVKFIKDFDKSYSINENTIALLKRRPVVKRKRLVKTPEWNSFVSYIQTKFPDFDVNTFNE